MSKAILITYRDKINLSEGEKIKNKLIDIENKILPSNISANKIQFIEDDHSIIAVFNPVKSISSINSSLCLGYVVNDKWYDLSVSQDKIEGSFAIFRQNNQNLHLITDLVGSRTIWYYYDTEKIIASTSQLAIIYFLGSFEFNNNVVPWMLSTGTLGPFLSWDKRIQALKPNSILNLSKETWSVSVHTSKVEFKEKPNVNHQEKLKDVLIDTFKKFKFNTENWVLPLSGGFDSRGILLFLVKNNKEIETLTWGTEKAQYQKDNDAYLGRQLAQYYGLKHNYLLTESSDNNIEDILNYFLLNGEGRIDHLPGYMDGFKIWKTLFENNFSGIIRGDEGFGWHKVYTEDQSRASVGLTLCQDFENLNKIKSKLNIEQSLPDDYKKRPDESLEQWRDRLYHTYRIPVILAALNDLKLSYVEIVNPLLFSSVLEAVYNMPDDLRSEKKAYKQIIRELSPKIPFAKSSANLKLRDLLKDKTIVEYLKKEIAKGDHIFENGFLQEIMSNMKVIDKKPTKLNLISKFKALLLKNMPVSVKQLLRLNVKGLNNLDSNLLAFRVFIIVKMNNLIATRLNK